MAELNFSLEKVYWKEEVPVDITPTTEPQTVTPEAGQAFNQVNVSAIPAPVLQDKVVTPTEQTQNVRADTGYDGLDEVQVNPIPPEYVVPSGTENITANGDYDIADKASAHVAVEPVLENKTVTPTEQTQTVEADAGYDGLDTVTVNPIPPEYVVPTGSVEITANGQGIDVAGKAEVNVNVPQGVFPAGTKLITQNVTGEDVTNYAAVDVAVPGIVPTGTKQISITANGTTTEDVSEYAEAEITVNTDPEKGLVFEDYDSDGYPYTAIISSKWGEMANDVFNGVLTNTNYLKVCKNLVFRGDAITLLGSTFRGCTAFETVNIQGDCTVSDFDFYGCSNLKSVIIPKIKDTGQPVASVFRNDPVELYDFSAATRILRISFASAIGHATGCVIRIPAALSDTTLGTGNGWESATNWSALTDIVWEVV